MTEKTLKVLVVKTQSYIKAEYPDDIHFSYENILMIYDEAFKGQDKKCISPPAHTVAWYAHLPIACTVQHM